MYSRIFTALLVLVSLAPLPLGGNRPLPWSLMAMLVGVLLIVWSSTVIAKKETHLVFIKGVWVCVVLFVLASLWAALQTSSVLPESWSHPLWNESSKALGEPLTGYISLDTFKSSTALMRLLSYGGVFWISLQLCRSSRRARLMYLTLASAGFVYASYGLIVYLGKFNTILWYEKWAYLDDLTSVFVNRNSFATYAGLTLICAIAIFMDDLIKERSFGFSNKYTIRVLLEKLSKRWWIYLILIFTVTTALLLSHSRGGLISAISGIVIFFLVLAGAESRERWKVSIVLIIFAIMGAVFSISGQGTVNRMYSALSDAKIRQNFNEQSMQAITAEPWLGYGYGTYENVAPMFRDDIFHPFVLAAHNTYLENIMDLGTPAALALFLSIGGLGLICLRGVFTRRRNVVYPCAGLAATALISVHSLVDFSLQMPAVAITYSAIMGVACAQSFSSSK
ncbi:hypothetical protein MNBD_NITROSPINAE04-2435 [hydrothermal vent metagenome]|uniref:O-antigen ligase-related domain-containing protein n=1 Tax=hydrothermal vent metagenome TaxID=652676 RepID=A0A3B1BP29_9ZZZZ